MNTPQFKLQIERLREKIRQNSQKKFQFIKKHKTIIFLSLAIISFALISYLMRFLVVSPWDLILLNIGKIDTYMILLSIIMIYFIGYIGYVFIELIYYLMDLKPNWSIYLTIFLMISSFYVGVAFISTEFGVQPLDLILRDEWGKIVKDAQIDCTLADRYYIIENKVTCGVKSNLKDVSTLVLLYPGGREIKLSENQSFTARSNVTRISFEIQGIDKNNEVRHFSTGAHYSFLTESEGKEARKEFIQWTLALFGIILFAVPSMVVNFKNLLK